MTLDFELRKHRDYAAAYHFLKRLLTTNGRPDRLVTDQCRTTLKAVKHLIKQDYLNKSTHQCSKYRNNLTEQDHRFIKRHRVRSASFQSIRTGKYKTQRHLGNPCIKQENPTSVRSRVFSRGRIKSVGSSITYNTVSRTA